MATPKLDEATIFDRARHIEGPEARLLYIQQACAGDQDLFARVEALLRMDEEDPGFLESPAKGLQGAFEAFTSERLESHIGPYRLIERIGEGGFGVVFMAEQLQPVSRTVALKVLKPGMNTRQVIARFEAERQALALMDHPNIAKVLDAGTTGSSKPKARNPKKIGSTKSENQTPLGQTVLEIDASDSESVSDFEIPASNFSQGRPYFVMELVKGVPITRYCDEHRLNPRERLGLFIPVCQAVQHAHQKGIIHRDLKPSNVLVADYDGRPVPKVIDFGVAKALGHPLTGQTLTTSLGGIIGTLEYMSPEQADFGTRDVDTRADIYSLGVLLYELLTGTTPLTKERMKQASVTELLRAIREEEPPKPSARLTYAKESLESISAKRKLGPARLSHELRGELDWIVMKCLEKDRDRRYQTANGLVRDLERYLADEPVEARPPSAGYKLRKFARKNRKVLAVAIAFALLLLAGTVVSLWQAIRATRAEIIANEQRDRAEAETRRSHRNLYDAHMRLAQSAWDEAAVRRVHDLLEQHRPSLGDEDLRGFEWHYLQRLSDSPLRTFTGHTDQIMSVAFSPDAKSLASASFDGTVRIWDAQTGHQKHKLEGHAGFVSCVAFSPDGKQLASACQDGTLRLWDANSGQPLLRPFKGHSDRLKSVVFSPDGKRLASAGHDGTVKVWDTATGMKTVDFEADKILVHAVAFSPDGKWLATACRDTKVKLWDASNGVDNLPLEGHTDEVTSVAFSPDGKQLVSGSLDRTATVWDVTSPAILDPVRPRLIQILKGHTDRVFGVTFSPDGKRVASASVDQTIRIWDWASGDEELKLRGHTSWVSSVTFSPQRQQGRFLIASASHDQTMKLWDVASAGETSMIITHGSLVKSVAFSPDGKRLASAGTDARIKIWDAASGRLSLIFQHSHEVASIAFSADGRRLASGSLDKTVKVWDLITGQKILDLKGPTGAVLSVAFSPDPDGKRLAAGSTDSTVTVWDLASGQEPLILRDHSGAVESVAFSPDGQWLASGSYDQTIKLWDGVTGRLTRTLQGHTSDVSSVVFSPQGDRLASTCGDATMRIWDTTSGQQLQELKGHTLGVYCVVFSPDGKRLASSGGNLDKTVKLWDAISGQETLSLKGHALGIPSVAFSPDGLRIASASFDGTIRVYDARPWTPQLRIEQPARNLISHLYAEVGKKAEVIRRIEQDSSLSAEVRQEALEMTKRWRE